MPPTKCTEIAPAGSSTFNLNSSHSIAKMTSPPATLPTITATAGLTKAHPALLATSPPIQPLAVREASGLPKRRRVTIAAVNPPDAAAKIVLSAIKTTRSTPTPAKSRAPAEFSPNHPANPNTQPKITKTMLCAGIAAGMPWAEYLPRRGLRIHAIESAVKPPTTWIVLEPPASTNPRPSP